MNKLIIASAGLGCRGRHAVGLREGLLLPLLKRVLKEDCTFVSTQQNTNKYNFKIVIGNYKLYTKVEGNFN